METEVAVHRLGLPVFQTLQLDSQETQFLGVESGVVRVDILSTTRHVNHHFESEKDGHQRKYTLRVQVNETYTDLLRKFGSAAYQPQVVREKKGVTSDNILPIGYHPSGGKALGVKLKRAMDSAMIPYDSLYGITLMTVMRLGLQAPQRLHFYHEFVSLPVYQDETPWNVVLQGVRRWLFFQHYVA